jgi:predicted aldo/keto reductase-like oxidoreductase
MLNNMLTGGGAIMDIMMRRQIKNDYNNLAQTKEEREKTEKDGSSLLCIDCGECVPKCPQSIDIPKELKKVNEVITKQKITPKEIRQLLIYAIKNWRLVLSRIRR